MLGIQLIDRVETLHNAGFVHRDIKPDNLAMGLDDESSTLYMLDLGLGKRYMQGNRHISMRHDKSLTGTARYASMNSHRGYELSRRDDMESIAYVLIYMLRGNLPWQGFHTNCELTKYRQIYQSKKQTSMQSLCRGFEPEIGEFLEYTRKLEFEEKPDYEGWRQKFRAVMERKKYDFDYIYCWTLPTDKAYRDKEEAKAKAQAEAKRLREMRARKLAAEKRRRDKLKKRRVWAPNYNDNIFPSKMPLDQRRALVLQQMQRGPLQDGGTPQPIPLQEFSPFFPAYQPVQFPVLFDQPPTNLQPGSFFLF
ncbi:Casein kinase I isoform delta [Rhizopus stolonifer]|uniref:Casein kinase I isoform delta n=2 Tax=Mucorineae TaxID=1344963 RepID=A0A367IN37_RHIST|nr:Casein kinase I isoform delta [Rhizopus stolonifer]